MTATTMNGAELAARIREDVAREVEELGGAVAQDLEVALDGGDVAALDGASEGAGETDLGEVLDDAGHEGDEGR